MLTIRLSSIAGVAALVLWLPVQSTRLPPSTDSVTIVSISPDSIARGIRTNFTVVIDTDLESVEQGVLQVGFNDAEANRFRMTETRILAHGRQRFSLALHAVPVDWGSDDAFMLLANIGPPRTPPRWSATAAAHRAIPFK